MSNKPPWDNEPTPWVDEAAWDQLQDGGCAPSVNVITSDDARDLERRMRHAERLLEEWPGRFPTQNQWTIWLIERKHHLQAAKEQDGC